MITKGTVVRVRGFQGVACYFVGYRQEVFIPDGGEDTGEWVDVNYSRPFCNTDDLELRDDETRAIVVMVGDDHKHCVPIEYLTPIPREDYCGVCGQIGCAHDGLDRSERTEA